MYHTYRQIDLNESINQSNILSDDRSIISQQKGMIRRTTSSQKIYNKENQQQNQERKNEYEQKYLICLDKVKVLSKENEKLKNHICVYSTQNEILDQEKKILEKNLEDLQYQIESIQSSQEKQPQKMELNEIKMKELNDQIQRLQKENERLKKENEQLLKNDHLLEELRESRQKIEDLQEISYQKERQIQEKQFLIDQNTQKNVLKNYLEQQFSQIKELLQNKNEQTKVQGDEKIKDEQPKSQKKFKIHIEQESPKFEPYQQNPQLFRDYSQKINLSSTKKSSLKVKQELEQDQQDHSQAQKLRQKMNSLRFLDSDTKSNKKSENTTYSPEKFQIIQQTSNIPDSEYKLQQEDDSELHQLMQKYAQIKQRFNQN